MCCLPFYSWHIYNMVNSLHLYSAFIPIHAPVTTRYLPNHPEPNPMHPATQLICQLLADCNWFLHWFYSASCKQSDIKTWSPNLSNICTANRTTVQTRLPRLTWCFPGETNLAGCSLSSGYQLRRSRILCDYLIGLSYWRINWGELQVSGVWIPMLRWSLQLHSLYGSPPFHTSEIANVNSKCLCNRYASLH